MVDLVEVARLPNRPSDLLNMRQDGYGPMERLEVDLGFVSFVRRFERMLEETEMKPLPKRKKGERPKVPRPKHSKEAILRALDIIIEKDPELARDFVHRDEDWGSDEDWEGHPDPGDDDEEWEHAEDEDD